MNIVNPKHIKQLTNAHNIFALIKVPLIMIGHLTKIETLKIPKKSHAKYEKPTFYHSHSSLANCFSPAKAKNRDQ
jgi:hypothetical protein